MSETSAQPPRPEYFVLAYDAGSMQVISLVSYERDFVRAVLALTRLMDEHRDDPAVAVELLAAPSFAALLEREQELFSRLQLPESDR